MPDTLTPEQEARLEAEVYPLERAAFQHRQNGEKEQDAELHREALMLREAIFGPLDVVLAEAIGSLAVDLRDEEQCEEAEALFLRALSIYEARQEPSRLEVASILFDFGCLYDNWERYEMSLPIYQRALAIEETLCGKYSPEAAATCTWLGDAYVELSQYAEAEPYLRRAVLIHRTRQAIDGTMVLILTLERLASVLFRLKRYNDALVAYQELRELTGGKFQFRNSRRRFNRCRVKCLPAMEAVMQGG